MERRLAMHQKPTYRTIMTQPMTRRQFNKRAIGTLSVGALSTVGFPFIRKIEAANEKLNIVAIGTGNRAGADIAGIAHENLIAVADVDSNFLGQATTKYKGAKGYQDFRVMLEKESDKIDAVVVGSPDHTHAPAAAMALRMGKPVYCEKPLTHTVHESRVLMDLAAERKLVTQMGNQIHAGENYREVVELIKSGAIGKVDRVHVWVNVSLDYSDGSFASNAPTPKHLDWDLWLGPAEARPYSEGIHPFTWRKFWDYGTGRLGDFGCHYLDLAHWALDLDHPETVATNGPKPNPISPPSWLKVDYQYPQAHVTWYGGHKPKLIKDLKDTEGKPIDWGSGQLFVGSTGMILSNYSKHLLFQDGKVVKQIDRPQASIPRSIGHHREWTNAIRTGGQTTCNFNYAGNLSQAVLLGSVAFKTGKKLHWNGKAGVITNVNNSAALLHKEYRKGWTL